MFASPHAPIANHPDLLDSAEKLAVAGEQAGFTISQMVDLLSAGLTVDTILDLIAWRDEILSHEECESSECHPVGM
ncbi:MAG TPA: hypothetical protein VHR84_21670 [Terriglobales bacterium]|jgi:hypothetical protein|nr:hypothetical protein [Terriglobales bacterium]